MAVQVVGNTPERFVTKQYDDERRQPLEHLQSVRKYHEHKSQKDYQLIGRRETGS
jgi:hypothetical protein